MAAIRTLDEQLLVGIAPGTWVAISNDQDEVIATGESIEAVLEKSREKGTPHPFVIRVPEQNSALIL
jgi:hypothetical protein